MPVWGKTGGSQKKTGEIHIKAHTCEKKTTARTIMLVYYPRFFFLVEKKTPVKEKKDRLERKTSI